MFFSCFFPCFFSCFFHVFFFIDNRKYLKIQKRLIEQGFHQPIQQLGIETVGNMDAPDIPTIDGNTLRCMMQERKDVIVIDTRFSFEYEGFSKKKTRKKAVFFIFFSLFFFPIFFVFFLIFLVIYPFLT